MPKAIDLTGERFGRLTVIKKSDRDSSNKILWECKCDCGTITKARTNSLTSGHTSSCGCFNKEISSKKAIEMSGEKHPNFTHGHTTKANDFYSRTYKSWRAMKARCLNQNHKHYKFYGGKGIKICDRWLGKYGFDNFLKDMGERPVGKTLDRIESNGNYERSNCRWATPKEQAQNRNKRNTKELF